MACKKDDEFTNMNPFEERYPIYLFPFHELCSVKATDYVLVSLIINKLRKFIKCKELFDKSKNYFNCTLDFLLCRSNFMMKDDTHQNVFKALLEVLKCIIKEFPYASVIFDVEIIKILNMLINLINSFQPNYIKEIGCRCITDLVEFSNVDTSELFNIYPAVLTVFETTNSVFEMGRFIHSMLKKNLNKSNETVSFLSSVESHCVMFLNKQIQIEESKQLLMCLVLLHMKEDERFFVLQNDTMKTLLQHSPSICAYAKYENFRPYTNYLLSIIILKSNILGLSWSFRSILKQIQLLPTFYQDWPSSENDIFFVIAYVLLIKCSSQTIWSPEAILLAINRYLIVNSLPRPEILRAVVMLFSIFFDFSNSITNTSNSEKMLFNILSTYNSLKDVLILNRRVISWILPSAEPSLKARVIKYWFSSDITEERLIEDIEKSHLGRYLVKFLINNSDTSISSKVSEIVSKLTPDIQLSAAIYDAIPQICNRPHILGNLLQVKEQQRPKSIIDVKLYIQIVFIALPYFAENKSIKAACCYIKNLHNVTDFIKINIERKYLFNSLNCLIAHAASKNDEVAVEALELLNGLLVKNLICVVSKTTDMIINIPFIDILQGNSQRIESGLKLLVQLLDKVNNELFLSCSQKLFPSLYIHLHSLANQNTINRIFRILKLLLVREPNLSFSISTLLLVQLVYIKYLNENTEKSYNDFLKVWQKIKEKNVSL